MRTVNALQRSALKGGTPKHLRESLRGGSSTNLLPRSRLSRFQTSSTLTHVAVQSRPSTAEEGTAADGAARESSRTPLAPSEPPPAPSQPPPAAAPLVAAAPPPTAAPPVGMDASALDARLAAIEETLSGLSQLLHKHMLVSSGSVHDDDAYDDDDNGGAALLALGVATAAGEGDGDGGEAEPSPPERASEADGTRADLMRGESFTQARVSVSDVI